jgi:hypothetical protein
MKKYYLVLMLAGFIALVSCKEETFSYQENQVTGKPYDPNVPVEISGFTPDSGKIREKVVITGSNFGNDKEQVQVFFNDGFSDKEAIVISVDGTSIYCLAPRQSDGRSQIKVVVNKQSTPAVASKTFRYTAAITVSWVAGVGTRDGYGAKYNDGTLSEANFWKPQGIVALGDEQIMTFGFHEAASNHVRFISVKDDKVTTIQSGAYLGKPAVNETRTKVYATTLNPPHTVYEYKKESGWMPFNIGILEVPGFPNCCDRIRSLAMMDRAHDPNEEWLYFCHKDQNFGRFNINTGVTEILSSTLDVPVKNWAGYLVYDKFNDCFYVSLYESYSIYRISRTGANWADGVQAELFAGSPSQSAVIDGPLEDARFRQPMGMCMDDEGNIYICDCNNADVIRKISAIDGYVSTIAGTLNKESPQVNGNPAEAVFLDPQDISYDGDGNFYITEWWEATIRKYAVE